LKILVYLRIFLILPLEAGMIKNMALLGISMFCVMALFMLFLPKGPSASSYAYLKQPQKRVLADQKMVVVEAQGDPEEVGPRAFKMLFTTYLKIPGVPKGPKQPAPRARWLAESDISSSQRIGRYALPITPRIDRLPGIKEESGLSVSIATWTYGQVAEILHVGPYTEETGTLEKLKNFIHDQGDSIIGDHEEEYIKGPSMFSQGDPKNYCTIIRYRVMKKEP